MVLCSLCSFVHDIGDHDHTFALISFVHPIVHNKFFLLLILLPPCVIVFQDVDEMTLQSKFMLVCDFASLGFQHITLWSTGRRPEDEETLYKFNQITAYPWCDDRLLRVVKSFLLTEDDVFAIRKTFQRMTRSRTRTTLLVQDLFKYIVSSFVCLPGRVF